MLAASTIVPNCSKSGQNGLSRGRFTGLPSIRYTTPITISTAAGIIVPKRPPAVLSLLAYFMPRKLLKVHIQYTPNTISKVYMRLPASFASKASGQKTYASDTAPNISTAGNHITTICQSRYMLSHPVRVPKASDTQRKTPPERIYVEASSAHTSA